MPKAIMETSKGTINLELFVQDAPNTVANFTKLANSKFYDLIDLGIIPDVAAAVVLVCQGR